MNYAVLVHFGFMQKRLSSWTQELTKPGSLWLCAFCPCKYKNTDHCILTYEPDHWFLTQRQESEQLWLLPAPRKE